MEKTDFILFSNCKYLFTEESYDFSGNSAEEIAKWICDLVMLFEHLIYEFSTEQTWQGKDLNDLLGR